MRFTQLSLEALFLSLLPLASGSANAGPTLQSTNGVVENHLFIECTSRGALETTSAPVDTCVRTPNWGLTIKTAAICANGTRALFMRWTDDECGYGTMDPDYGLVPMHDGVCLNSKKVESIAFWCDGVKDTRAEGDLSKKGSASEGVCEAGIPLFYTHSKADTCVNLETGKLRVSHMAVCGNGTQSTLALYEGADCFGAPSEFRALTDEDMEDCIDVEGSRSYAFYCTGEITQAVTEPAQNAGKGSVLHFFAIIAIFFLLFSLMLVLTVLAWIRKYGGSVGKIIEVVTVSSPIMNILTRILISLFRT
jgi:hypothetical protein